MKSEFPTLTEFTGAKAKEIISSFKVKPSLLKVAIVLKMDRFNLLAFINSKGQNRGKLTDAQVLALYELLKLYSEANGVINSFKKQAGRPKKNGAIS